MTPTVKGSKSPLKVVSAILAVIVVLLFVGAGVQIKDTSQGYTIEYDARDYMYSAEYGRYGQLYETAVHDMGKQTDYSAEVAEYRALAFYYEQAVLEHAYRTAGDNVKADAFAERMREYEGQLGSMSSKAEAVRKAVSG